MIAMKNEVNFQCNKLLKLDNTMLMYGIYCTRAQSIIQHVDAGQLNIPFQ